MLDIKFIRENKEGLKRAIKNKNVSLDIDELISLDKKRIDLLQEIEKLNAQKNDLNEEIKKAKNDADRKTVIEKGKDVKDKISKIEPEFKEISQKFNELMIKVPTIPSADTPVGKNDEDNVEIMHWGEIKKFDFNPKDHIQLGKDLDIIDLKKGAKVAGYRGYFLKNDGVALVLAMMMYAINKMIQKGYKLFLPPTLVKGFALFGSGYFRGLDYDPEVDEIYQVVSSDKEMSGEKSITDAATTMRKRKVFNRMRIGYLTRLVDADRINLQTAVFSFFRRPVNSIPII